MYENNLFSYTSYSGADYKESLIKRAKDSYLEKEIEDSVFYQIKSLCTGFESRYGIGKQPDVSETNINLKQDQQQFKEHPLFKYAIEYLKSKQISKTESWLNKPDKIDSIDSLQSVQNICSSLPQEWTIIQLCKEQRENTNYSLFREIIADPAPIYLSILKHPRSKQFPKPLCLRLTSDIQEEVYKKFSILTDSFAEYSVIPPGVAAPKTNQELQNYWSGMAVLERRVADAISDLKTFMGPWISLLCGNVKPRFRDKQQKIFKAVDKFCDSNNIESHQQRVLLSLLAQQRHLLSDEHVEQASFALAAMKGGEDFELNVDGIENKENEEEENSTISRVIYEFLMELPSEDGIAFGPCILILDERIDHFYWEVLNPWQELCRMSSFNILIRLYERYKSKIKNGYLMADVENGRCVVNPDSNLPNMQGRMKRYFDYWLPHWKCTYSVVPRAEDYITWFDEADCYVYCGHGSGLQYVNGRKISKFQMKCVVFLFGCDSVRLRSQGFHSEMVGSHLFYHAALCPAVVGTLQLGFDFQVDKIATDLLSKWIPSHNENVVHWLNIDKALWKKGTIQAVQSKQSKAKPVVFNEGSLARAVCAIHQKTDEKLYNTVGFVYRGLPVWNSSNSHID